MDMNSVMNSLKEKLVEEFSKSSLPEKLLGWIDSAKEQISTTPFGKSIVPLLDKLRERIEAIKPKPKEEVMTTEAEEVMATVEPDRVAEEVMLAEPYGPADDDMPEETAVPEVQLDENEIFPTVEKKDVSFVDNVLKVGEFTYVMIPVEGDTYNMSHAKNLSE